MAEPPVDRKLREDPKPAPAHVAGAMLSFNEQIERILEAGVVLMVGAALPLVGLQPAGFVTAAWLFLLACPLAALPGWWTRQFTPRQFAGIAWFGVRGIGSIYYLMYAAHHGLEREHVELLTSITLTVVALSVVGHGISVTPLQQAH